MSAVWVLRRPCCGCVLAVLDADPARRDATALKIAEYWSVGCVLERADRPPRMDVCFHREEPWQKKIK